MHRMELVVRERRGGGEQVTALGWIDLASADAEPGPQACQDALRRVLEHLRAHPWPQEPAPHGWTFALRDDCGGSWDEHALYRIAAAGGGSDALLLELVGASAQGAHGHRPWADAETPTGTSAILALAMRERALLPEYLRFLRQCDLDHEVDQAGDLDELLAHHGWADDTCALVAARLGSCSGQWGEEQVGRWREEGGLGDYLAAEAGERSMLAAAKAEFEHDGPWARGVVRAPGSIFDDEVRYHVDLFAPCLTASGLAELEAHVRALRTRDPARA